MKKFSSLGVVIIFLVLSMTVVVSAEQHDRLLPLLGDIAGWQAPQPAHGMSLVSAQMRMISANRIYTKGDKTLALNIMVNSGPVVDSDLQESNFENDTVKTRNRQVDGFWMKTTQNKKNDSGEVIVCLDYNQEANGVLVINYTKMTEDEVLQLIKTLGLDKLKRVVSAML